MKIRMSKTLIIASVLTLGLATAAFAQFGMNGDGPKCHDQRQGPPPMKAKQVMDSGTTGVYILEGPKFTKYDSATLEQLGQLELGIPADAVVTNTDGENPMMPPPPPIPSNFVIYNGSGSTTEFLLAVAGDTFYKISGDTFAVVVKTPLPAPAKPGIKNNADIAADTAVTDTTATTENDQQMKGRPEMGGPRQGEQGMDDRQGPPQGGPEMRGPAMPPPAQPKLDLNGDILYILRGNQLTSISVADGSIKASVVTGTPPAAKKSAPARKSRKIKN
jgi:hypothetical protein